MMQSTSEREEVLQGEAGGEQIPQGESEGDKVPQGEAEGAATKANKVLVGEKTICLFISILCYLFVEF